MTLPFALFGFWALRNLAIAVIVIVPVVARAARRADDGDAPVRAESADRLAGWFVAGLAGLALAFVLQAVAQPSYDVRGFSVHAYRALAAQHLAGTRVFTTDANAGWMLAAHFPQQRVFMDDRYDMYPLGLIADYQKMSQGQAQWSSLLDHYRIDAVIWPRTRSLTQLLAESPEWQRTYSDKDWVLFTRSHFVAHHGAAG